MDTVNCGRSLESEDFWKSDVLDKQLCTGIISGPTSQNPGSLATRLALQFVADFEDEDAAVFCPLLGSPPRLQSATIGANRVTELHHSLDLQFELLTDGLQLSNYQVCTLCVVIDVEACGSILHEAFDIIHQKINTRIQEIDHALLLLVYRHEPSFRTAKLRHHLETKAASQANVKYYPVTKGVTKHELRNWVQAHTSAPVDDIEHLLKPFANEPSEGEVEQKVLPMRMVESIQSWVFQYAMTDELA